MVGQNQFRNSARSFEAPLSGGSIVLAVCGSFRTSASGWHSKRFITRNRSNSTIAFAGGPDSSAIGDDEVGGRSRLALRMQDSGTMMKNHATAEPPTALPPRKDHSGPPSLTPEKAGLRDDRLINPQAFPRNRDRKSGEVPNGQGRIDHTLCSGCFRTSFTSRQRRDSSSPVEGAKSANRSTFELRMRVVSVDAGGERPGPLLLLLRSFERRCSTPPLFVVVLALQQKKARVV